MSAKKKPVGRPVVNATPVTVRIPPDMLRRIDDLRRDYPLKNGETPSRPEAIRQILDAAFKLGAHAK